MNRRYIRITTRIIAVCLLIGCVILVIQTFRLAKAAEKQFGLSPLSMYQLVTDGEAMVKTTEGRTNILILGIGGGDHEGPDLTDTIILLSFSLTEKTLALISIPRDIWSDSLKDKINSAYHYGEEKKKDGGLTLASAMIEDIVSMPVHYTIVVDFSQFESIIDYIGGIDITVPVAFTDSEYPISGKENDDCGGDLTYACRYQTVSFTQGFQHMDGKKALMYVRSRHAEGGEGNDFARGRRQQDVIVAVKSRIIQMEPWYHPEMSLQLFQSFDKATKTDLTIGQLLALGKLGMAIKSETIQKISIEPYLTEAPTEAYGGYALIPKQSWEEIHVYIQSIISGS